tara:strand:+ start:1 stop:891 length:891 start_codon:yes stop_codon:yes gene_type:complete
MRTDIHRPSQIKPTDYEYIGIEFLVVGRDPKGELIEVNDGEEIQKHMEETGGTIADHRHGGMCQICGTNCVYTAIFYHTKSNTYLRTGFDCASNIKTGLENIFKRAKKTADKFRKYIAGKKKAQGILKEANLEECWTIFNYDKCPDYYEENTIQSIVSNLVKYGNISEKQIVFLFKLLSQISTRVEREAKRKAEREAAEDCPDGRVSITGTVLKAEWREGYYGSSVLKITVKDERGFLVWGTAPTIYNGEEDVDVRKHDKISFRATVTQSDKDSKFGFYKRPVKGEFLAIAVDNRH